MDLVLGITIIILGLLGWGGQALAWYAPDTAVRVGLADAEDTVEAVFWADSRGEALWDAISLWTFPLAGMLLLVDLEAWAWLGLVGGGMYVYFAGRGILARLEMRRRGFRIGVERNVRVGLVALGVWGVAGLVTIGAAIAELA
jgi:hypothetical protein